MNETKTKEQLLIENSLLKKRIVELENSNPQLNYSELRESEEKFRGIFELSPLGKSLTSSDGSLSINAAFSEMLGYSIDKLKSIHWKEITHPDDIRKSKRILQSLIQGNKTNVQFEKRYIHKNGNIVWTESIITIKRDNNNKFEYFLTTAKDITEHKLADNALKSSEERLKIVFESAPDAFYLSDLKGHFLDGNKAAENLIGYKKEELLGSNIFNLNLVSVKQLPNVTKAITRGLIGKKSGPDEFVLSRKDGSKVHAEISTFPVKINNKTVVLGIARDITQRLKSEKALRDSDALMKSIFKTAPTGIGVVVNRAFTMVNNRLCEMTGYSEKDLINRSAEMLYPSKQEFDKVGKIKYDKIIKFGSGSVETRWCRKDGAIINVLLNSTPIDKNDLNNGVTFTALDITERKTAEETLKENEQKLRNILENSTNLFYSHDTKHVNTYLSPQIKNILGYTQEEALLEWTNFVSDNPVNKGGFDNTEKAIETGKRQPPYELELIKKSGNKIWVEVREFPLVEDGKTKAIVGSLTDITDRKRSDQIQNALYNISNEVATTDKLKQLIAIIQKELGEIIDTTNFYVALHQPETDKLLLPFISDEKDNLAVVPEGKTLTKLVFTTNKSLLVDVPGKRKLVKEGKINHFGTLSKIWLGVPLNIEEKVIGVLAVQSYTNEKAFNMADMKMLEIVSDQISTVIYRKQVEDDIKDALEKATESDRLKSAFLANMSHEIRTPMNGILGFASLLEEPGLTGSEQNQYIEVIKKSGDRMLNTINDIIDFSKIEAGQASVSIAPVNVQEQMKFLHTFFKPETEKKGIQLKLKPSSNVEQVLVETDRLKLNAVLTNLIKNAIKYTAAGSIEFACTIAKTGGSSFLQFYVKDTGMGIPKERQEAIFDRFVQADIEDRQALQGSGLGLSISKAYVEMLGGEIWVESEPEKGSTFYFKIAYKEFKAIPEPVLKDKGKPDGFLQKTILIVEDVEISYHLLKLVLKNAGIKTIWAKHGKEAIEYCKDNAAIDLVLMDISMPVMNGYLATKAIRKFRPNLPVIAQTAYAISGDREKSIAAGCVDYISKPIKKDELIKIIGKYI